MRAAALGRAGARHRPATARDIRRFWVGLAQAFAGAILFSLPLLMTMEMWWLGFSMDRLRLARLIVATVPILAALSHYSGFEATFDVWDDAVDAFVALAVGFAAAGVTLVDLGRLRLTGMTAWLFRGIVHIYILMTMRSRVMVFLSWMWSLLFGQRGAGVIFEPARTGPEDEPA